MSWSWRGGKARAPQAAPAPRRPAVAPAPPGVIPRQAPPAERVPDDAGLDASTSLRPQPPDDRTTTELPPDAHLRRALALVELSRLVLEDD